MTILNFPGTSATNTHANSSSNSTASALQTFLFEDQNVRIALDDKGEPWFVAADVCRILNLQDHKSALRPLEEDERGVKTFLSHGGPQKYSIINESGLYWLIFRSTKPDAKRFRIWVTNEVLPSIRKTGSYSVHNKIPDFTKIPETYEELMFHHQYVVGACIKLQKENEVIKPKALFYDNYKDVKGNHPLRALGKLFHLPPNGLIKQLIEDGFLYRCGKSLMAKQTFVQKKWFETKLVIDYHGRPKTQTVVTPKGVLGLAERYGFMNDSDSNDDYLIN
ncbi:MAG: hypothetical protein BGO28_05140 [Alphaproteobacteria bacterium 43-37]|nr:MAG: hypothetical protein BGO28_05140 [Alphaproteobacteria bacterium 43-37]